MSGSTIRRRVIGSPRRIRALHSIALAAALLGAETAHARDAGEETRDIAVQDDGEDQVPGDEDDARGEDQGVVDHDDPSTSSGQAAHAHAHAHAHGQDAGKKWEVEGEGGVREVPWVHIQNLYTGDILPVFGEEAAPESFARLLRCRATGKVMPIAPALPKLMLAVARRLEGTVVEIVSGYRSEKFNEQLRKKGHEVASESFHRLGLAIDWRIRGVPLQRLIYQLQRRHHGGLGIYRRSNFVHTDVGPERSWRGR